MRIDFADRRLLASLLFVLTLLLIQTASLHAGVTSERPLAAPSYGPAAGDQTVPTIATDGTDFLVVWRDGRAREPGMYAARVSGSGELLDPTGIRLDASGSRHLALWSGSSYIVLWVNDRGSDRSIRMARIGADGRMIEGPRTLIENAYAITSSFAASNGSRVIIGFQRFQPDGLSSLHVAVLDRDGVMLDEQPIALRHPNSQALAVTTNGSSFLAVWSSYDGGAVRLEAVAIDGTGTIDESSHQALLNEYTTHEGPVVSSDGEDYVVLLRTPGTENLRAVRFGADARVVSGPDYVGAPTGVTIAHPTLTWTGTDYLLLWADGQALRLDRNGNTPSRVPVTVRSGDGGALWMSTAIAADASHGLIVWVGGSPLNSFTWYADIYGAKFDPSSLAVGGGTLLSISAPRQTAASIAYGGTYPLVAWNEDSGVYVARVAPNGEFLDGRGIHVAEPLEYYTAHPRVVFDGVDYLVAWVDGAAGIRYMRIRPDDAAPIPGRSGSLTDCAVDFAMAAGDGETLIVWTDCESRALFAVRMARAGHPIDTVPIEIVDGSSPSAHPSIAWSGSQWLVVWEEWIEIPSGYPWPMFRSAIRAARMTRELTLLDHGGLLVAPSDHEQHTNSAPSVASDGDAFVVVWGSDEQFGRTREVRARHVGSDGVLGDLTTISSGIAPAVAWAGDRYLTAWEAEGHIRATWLTSDGSGSSEAVFALAATPDTEREVGLTDAGAGRVAATYTRIATEPLYGGVERVFLRIATRGDRGRPVARPGR